MSDKENCAYCKYNDGIVYTSSPPMYKCTINNTYYYGNSGCHAFINPTSIIRCKDCRNWQWSGPDNDIMRCNYWNYHIVDPDDYCSRGIGK